MGTGPLASIIVDNYNYGRYLADAIDSALAQTYRPIEVIVVDDGSTDDSREVMRTYEGRITSVLKENGGQASSFNAGFAHSSGGIVLILDADDMLLPSAVERAVPFFTDPEVVKVHWPLWLTDPVGRRTGAIFPGPKLAEGDLREFVLREGPTHHLAAPTSGNAWRRCFLDRVLPLPERVYRYGADTPLFEMAPFFGRIVSIAEPQAIYRQHGANDHTSVSIESHIRRELEWYDDYVPRLVAHLAAAGVTVDVEHWRRTSWWHLLEAAVMQIRALPHRARPIIVVDDTAWGPGRIAGRDRIPFLERNGEYWGAPADDNSAIEELERLRNTREPSHIVFAWSSWWWLDAYPGFATYLRTHYRETLATTSLIAFDLTQSTGRSLTPPASAAETESHPESKDCPSAA